MRRKFEIKAGEKYPFVIGQSDNYLIMRNLTDNIMLESDSFKNVELSRSDTVVISDYQNIELRLFNTSNSVIVGEIQLSEVDIRIKEQRMGIEGGVVIDEIITPVVVSEIQKPVVVESVRNPVSIITDATIKVQEQHERYSSNWTTFSQGTARMYGPFVYLMIQAAVDNLDNISFCGIEIPPGGYFEVPVAFNSSSEIINFENGTDKCNVFWIRDMSLIKTKEIK
jgi:hypothetical protein